MWFQEKHQTMGIRLGSPNVSPKELGNTTWKHRAILTSHWMRFDQGETGDRKKPTNKWLSFSPSHGLCQGLWLHIVLLETPIVTKQLAVLFCEAVANWVIYHLVFVSILPRLTSPFPSPWWPCDCIANILTHKICLTAFSETWGKRASESFCVHLNEYFIFKYCV